MGYDLFGAILFALMTPFVILGFIVFWTLTHRERTHIEDTWESYAATRAREYFPARGEWPNRTSPGLRWHDDSVAYAMTVIGVEAGARTRVIARPRNRVLGSFLLRFREGQLVTSEQPRGLAERVLGMEDARRALLGFRQHDDVTLAYRRGRLVLEWPGREANHPRLDEAAAVMAKWAARSTRPSSQRAASRAES